MPMVHRRKIVGRHCRGHAEIPSHLSDSGPVFQAANGYATNPFFKSRVFSVAVYVPCPSAAVSSRPRVTMANSRSRKDIAPFHRAHRPDVGNTSSVGGRGVNIANPEQLPATVSSLRCTSSHLLHPALVHANMLRHLAMVQRHLGDSTAQLVLHPILARPSYGHLLVCSLACSSLLLFWDVPWPPLVWAIRPALPHSWLPFFLRVHLLGLPR